MKIKFWIEVFNHTHQIIVEGLCGDSKFQQTSYVRWAEGELNLDKILHCLNRQRSQALYGGLRL